MKTQNELTHIGTEWFGEIPEQWQISKLWELYTFKKERSEKEEELLSVYRDHGVIPKSSRDDNHNQASEDLSNYLLVRPDDLVINKMKAWQGSVSISSYRGIVSPAYFTYRLTNAGKAKLNLRYLHHLLRSRMYIETYKRISKGIRPGQWDLEPYQFKILPIILPPLETQRKIAAFLDEKTKAIDALVEKKEKLIELLREKRLLLISEMVTRGRNSDENTRVSEVEWVDKIPEKWQVRKLKYIASINTSGLFGNESLGEVEAKLVTTGNLSMSGDWYLDDMDTRFFSKEEYNKYKNEVGDIVVVKSSGSATNIVSGKAGYVSESEAGTVFGNFLLRIRPRAGVISKYLFYFLTSHLTRQRIELMCSSTTYPNLKIPEYVSSLILLPPISEQEQIVTFLDAETEKIKNATFLIAGEIERLREYRSSLIYSAVTGKIKI